MEYLPLKIGDKTAKLPIIQGGMGIGISLGGLAGAVAAKGGVGIISAAQIGFRDKMFEKNPLAANLKAMKEEFEKARNIAPKGIIGFNIMVAMRNYKEYVIQAAKIGADIIICGAGLAVELPEYVSGYATKIAPIVSTDKAAKVLLKLWDRKFKKTADLVVVEGPKAGGHLGFKEDQIEHFTDNEYENEINSIMNTVKEYEQKYEVKIPVVVAGGIDDSSKVKRMFEIGADGVQVASRFVATYECDAHDAFKQMYIQACEEDVEIILSPVGMPARAIKNDFINKINQGEKEKISRCYSCLNKCNQKEIPYCITDALVKAVTGDVNNGIIFCGANVSNIKKMETVGGIIDSLLK